MGPWRRRGLIICGAHQEVLDSFLTLRALSRLPRVTRPAGRHRHCTRPQPRWPPSPHSLLCLPVFVRSYLGVFCSRAPFVSTQKICQLEPEGRVKVDLVLGAAEALLASCHEAQKPDILARLKDIKAQWEETVTYMTHCHR